MDDSMKKKLLSALNWEDVVDASVWAVRSEDHHVHLTTNRPTSAPITGWALIEDPYAFALFAAAQASNRSVTFTYRSHDQSWGEGAGLFTGVHSVRLQGTGV